MSNIAEHHQENRVHFILEVPTLHKMSDEQILKTFKLQTTVSTTNLVLFTRYDKIARYHSEVDIMKEFFSYRKELYQMRKEYMLGKLQQEYEILFNKVKFIQAVIANKLFISGKKRTLIIQQCREHQLKTWPELQQIMQKFIKNEAIKTRVAKNSNQEDQDEANDDEERKEESANSAKDYDYLLTMPLWSLSQEKIDDLIEKMNQKKTEHDILDKTHIFDLWRTDLSKMLEVLD